MTMTANLRPCPKVTLEQLAALASHQLSPAEAQALEDHAATCPQCQASLKSLRRLTALIPGLTPPEPPAALRDSLWAALEPEVDRAVTRARWRRWLEPFFGGGRLPFTAAAMLVLLLVAGWQWYQARSPIPTPAAPGRQLTVKPPRPAPDPFERLPRRDLAELEAPGPQDPREFEPLPAPPALAAEEPLPSLELEVPGALAPQQLEPRPTLTQAEPAAPPAEPAAVLASPRSTDHPLTLASGATLDLRAARARILLDGPVASRIELAHGELRAQVPRLKPEGAFDIHTPDARVSVKGTRFVVEALGDQGTRVAVQEGRVWVQPSGRKRERLILGPGEEATVKGEGPYLQELLGDMGRAVMKDDLEGALQLGQRYLEVTSAPERAGEMKNRLAGVLEELGRWDEARRLYQETAGGADLALVRQNALLLLARSFEKTDGPGSGKALEARLELEERFPEGVYRRENLLWLGRATCGQGDSQAARVQEALRTALEGDPEAQALLGRCEAGAKP